ncbi:hypothetical protein FACS189476_04710 [Spirochaetia bacterium]|nr:hypothetical protein FACS189476_04710 [Spirochaetia bacterium]
MAFKMPGNPFKNRNVRYGTVSVIITLTVILFIVLLNAALGALFNRYPLNIDLTEDQIFEVSEDTKKFLSSLEDDITIYVLNTEDRFAGSSPAEYFIQANEVINKYRQLSPRVKLQYIDLIRNPDFNAHYPDVQLNVNDILITSGGKNKVVTAVDLFNIRSSYYGNYVASSKAEQTMTSAMLNVISKQKTLVSVITGHGEKDADIAGFIELMKMNAWDAVTQNLLTEEIAGDASLVILAAPDRDLSVEELQKIDAFLEGGNNRILFCLSDINQQELPNLKAFLVEWGLEVAPGTVFETEPARLLNDSPYFALADYAEENYSKNMVRQGILPVVPQSRPLKALFESNRYRTVTTLIRSSAASGIRPLELPEGWSVGPSTLTGNVPLLLLSSQTRNNAERDLVNAHVLLCGSFLALHEVVLGNPNFANSEYFLELLGRLAVREDQIYIQDKTMGFTELRADGVQKMVIGLIFAVLLPLAVFGAGIAVWLRRRHK